MSRDSFSDYDQQATARCERALVTLLGDIGPWSERIYLAGGLAPRYLIGQLPEGGPAHVGTTDVDLIIGLALGDTVPRAWRAELDSEVSGAARGQARRAGARAAGGEALTC